MEAFWKLKSFQAVTFPAQTRFWNRETKIMRSFKMQSLVIFHEFTND